MKNCKEMFVLRTNTLFFYFIAACLTFGSAAHADDLTKRTIVKRANLGQAENMELIETVTESQPGAVVERHSHHGLEAVYVIQGSTIQSPDGKPVQLETGATMLNMRDVLHAGYKVIGNTSLKLFTVHVVDRNMPLYEPAPQ